MFLVAGLREVGMEDWETLSDQVRSRLLSADAGTAVAFAAITAERLVRLDPQRRPFTRSLRPLLDLVWRAAAGDPTAYKPIAVAMGEFYLGPYCHNDGQVGPDDADDDPAAAILYASWCYLHSLPQFAVVVAQRAIDAVEYREDLAAEGVDAPPYDDDSLAAEARQQMADLDALTPYARQLTRARSGLPAAEQPLLLAALQRLVEAS